MNSIDIYLLVGWITSGTIILILFSVWPPNKPDRGG